MAQGLTVSSRLFRPLIDVPLKRFPGNRTHTCSRSDYSLQMLHVDALCVPSIRLLRPGGKLLPVAAKECRKRHGLLNLGLLVDLAIGEQKERQVPIRGRFEPSPLHKL